MDEWLPLPYGEWRETLRSTYDVGATLLGWPDDLTRFDVPGRARVAGSIAR